jgi:hypothetical protein
MRGRGGVVGVLAGLVVLQGAALAQASFDQPTDQDSSQQFAVVNPQRRDTPNDPNYDQAEPDHQPAPTSDSVFDERFDLFGFASQRTRNTAIYHDDGHGHHAGDPQISGFNAAGAWKLERGRPDVSVAILDTGIKWDRCGLRDKIRLNTGELPLPERADGTTNPSAGSGGYDLDGDGAVTVDDWAHDPRVGREFTTCGGQITGKDLIDAFSDHTDADGNGYVDDIAGWNFFDDNNDPTDRSSYFAAGNHGSGRTGEAVEKGNDGSGSIGVCPKCQFVPIRVWDTFVSDGNTFGMGMLYAADNGVQVIEGADGSLYHSAFAEAASQWAYAHGATQTYSGNDLNTGDHNYPANYNHTMEIQGVVTDVEGAPGANQAKPLFDDLCTALKVCPGTNAPVQSYFRGANTTQFGGHSSVAMEGSTGSQNTGKAAGAAALVVSAAKDHGIDPTPDEVRETIEQTAEDVTAPNTVGAGVPDPAQPGWDEHFGWGRVDLGKAVAVAASGKLPPQAAIDSPDWYAPLRGDSAALAGHLHARFAAGGRFHYKVEWGVGLAPTSWNTVKEGDSKGTVTDLGRLDLAAIRAQLAQRVVPQDTGGPVFSPTSRNPFQDQFAVRVTVTGDGVPTPGVDRKVLTAVPDGQDLRPGFPKRLGTGGEAPLRYADLNGDNVEELIVPTEDGLIHAYEPDGRELKGWPVRTQLQTAAADHLRARPFSSGAVAPPREPPRGPTVADLDGDGRPEVITTAGVHVYVFEPDGSLRPGFPVRNDPAFCRPEDETQPNGHHKCGFVATPAVGHLEGPAKPLDIVAPSLDGHLYVLRGDGSRVYDPVELVDPAASTKVRAESINDPAVGDLNGDGVDDVVVASNETYKADVPSDDVSLGGALGLAGQSARVYAVNGRDGTLLPGWPIHINGLIENVLPLVGPGNDAEIASVGGSPTVIASASSGSLSTYGADGKRQHAMRQEAFGPASNATDRSGAINLFESAAVGDLLGTGHLAAVKYALSVGGVANLLAVGGNVPYNHLMGAFDLQTGAPLPAWPTITDDFQFLSASTIAKVGGTGPTQQVLAQNGLGLLHAYDGATGQDVTGFPKVTGGWLFAPAALSDDGRMAGITREGYLFEWRSGAAACQTQWPEFRHDPHSTGNYDADGTPPDAPEGLSVQAVGGGRFSVSFVSPGDDRRCGTAKEYLARADGQPVDLGAPVAGGQTFSAVVSLPAGVRRLTVQASDEAGNVGAPATAAVPRERR